MPESCDAHKNQYTICTESGKLANEFCTSTERKSANYVVEKERLELWTTHGLNTTMGTAPTEYCTIHKKVVEETKPTTEKPAETPADNTTTKPDEGNNTTKPDSGTTKPDTSGGTGEKPGENTGNNTGGNTTGNTGGETTDNQ